MKILGIQKDHNSSACLFIDNELVYYNQEERLSRYKKDSGLPVYTLKEISKISNSIDVLLIAGYDTISSENSSIITTITKLGFTLSDNFKFEPYYKSHHLNHASLAFYNSQFEEALVVVCDGHGASYNLNNGEYAQETTSIFSVSNPNNFNLLYKRLFTNSKIQPDTKIIWNNSLGEYRTPVPNYVGKDTEIEIRNDYDLGFMYEGTSRSLGFDDEGGKMMSLQSFGNAEDNIPPVMKGNKFNMNVFEYNDEYKHKHFNYLTYPELKNTQTMINFSNSVQKTFQENGLRQIKKYLEVSKNKNLVITGGTALNVVANDYYAKNLKGTKIYIEPMCGDEGNCLGICNHFIATNMNKKIKPLSVYIGGSVPQYDYNLKENEREVCNADHKVAADLIRAGHIVALFQGKSEAGPRALGNRSLLFDPRISNGKDIVNTVKGREDFRPFAAAIMQEYSNEWFDLNNIEESPYMMFAVNFKNNFHNKVPAVNHVDNTCRIQTVTKNQNNTLYSIIEEFFKNTSIPMLLNTSFNLAGDPIVETVDDAINSLRKSKIEYLYLPEISKLIYIKN